MALWQAGDVAIPSERLTTLAEIESELLIGP